MSQQGLRGNDAGVRASGAAAIGAAATGAAAPGARASGGYPAVARERLLHMVGNAHIDPVWLWQWPEGLHEIRATFRSALERMDEYDDFVFTCDSVAYLAWVEQVDPELFAAIARRAAEGRFVIVGGWWVEPDCNLPHGESFVRQALYGQRFLHDRFGRLATVGCNVDPFGHAATLPQLLAKAGISAYMFHRPGTKEKALPAEVFWWATPDGSRVLAYRIPYRYDSADEALDTYIERAVAQAPPSEEQLIIFYGVGNHGGGPTRQNIDSIHRLDAADNGFGLRLAGPRPYFDAMAGRHDLATYVGDLQHHSVGCYSAHSGVKRWNRRAEHALLAAERWCTVAATRHGPAYPAAELAQAWKLVLFNQFHDILAGTAIAPAYEDARDQYGYACATAAGALNLAVQSVTGRIGIPAQAGTLPFVVINPLPWPVRADVEFEVEATSEAELGAIDEQAGTPVPLQRVRSLATIAGRHRRVVIAAEVPALGYRLYRLRPDGYGDGATAEPAPPAAPAAPGPAGVPATGGATPATGGATPATGGATPASGEMVLENAHLRLEVDPATGWLASFFDRDAQAELAAPDGRGHAVVLEDGSDTWSHDLVAYDQEVARFTCTSVRYLERGPVRAVIEVESAYGRSRLVEQLVLGGRARHLEVRVVLDWQEQHKVLKLRFPSRLAQATATFSVPYGRLERPCEGSEEVGQAWVDVSGVLAGGARAGWALLNDGKYGYDVRGADMGLTAARSPVYAWHDPCPLAPDVRYEHLDQGRQEFTYALVAHGAEGWQAGVVRLAEELNERPLAVPEHFHPGPLPPAHSFADDGSGAVVLSVIKQAEDAGAYVVRAYESTGRAGSARLALPLFGRTIESDFAPGEIKTFLVPGDDGPVQEVSLLEWPGQVPSPPARP